MALLQYFKARFCFVYVPLHDILRPLKFCRQQTNETDAFHVLFKLFVLVLDMEPLTDAVLVRAQERVCHATSLDANGERLVVANAAEGGSDTGL